MAVAIDIDRELVKSLVLQGKPTKEICSITGVKAATLFVWKNRFGWGKALRVAKQEYERGMLEAEQTELNAKAERVRAGIADELEHDLAIIKANPAKTIKNVQERQSALSAITGNAKTVFGWNDTIGVTLSIGLLNSANESAKPLKAIDVQSEQVVEPQQIRS